jgi:hypothetical protein
MLDILIGGAFKQQLRMTRIMTTSSFFKSSFHRAACKAGLASIATALVSPILFSGNTAAVMSGALLALGSVVTTASLKDSFAKALTDPATLLLAGVGAVSWGLFVADMMPK